MTGAACGSGNAYPSGAPGFISGFHRGSCFPVSNKGNNQNSKDKTITWNKETPMTGQHEPLKPEMKSGAPEG